MPGYELIDTIEITQSMARSLGVSNDGTIYEGTGSTVDGKLQVSGISTSTFNLTSTPYVFNLSQHIFLNLLESNKNSLASCFSLFTLLYFL